MHVQACVCACGWLWGVVDPGCRQMSRLISSHGRRSSIIHEINAEIQPGLIEDNLFPLRFFPPVLPSFLLNISQKINFPLTTLFSAENELWESRTWKLRVFTSRDDSQWETVRRTPVLLTPWLRGLCEAGGKLGEDGGGKCRKGEGNKVIRCCGAGVGECQMPNIDQGSVNLYFVPQSFKAVSEMSPLDNHSPFPTSHL